MTKKLFTGEKMNLPVIVKDVEEWFRQQGFEVQSGAGPGSYLVQARKVSTWRSILGNNQTLDVKIEGTPENFSIDLDAGTWVKNLTASGPAAIAAAFVSLSTWGVNALVSTTERGRVESALWKALEATCPQCSRIGAADRTGERLVRVEGTTQDASGLYKGTKVFTDTFKCRFCSHTWEKGETQRQGSLCPKCHDEKALRKTGERVIGCKKTDQWSQNGQPIGEQVFKDKFQCAACSHAWEGVNKARHVELCPHCEQVATGVYLGDTVVDRFTKHETQVVPDLHFRRPKEEDGLADHLAGQVYEGHTDRIVQFVVQYEVFTQNFRCPLCSRDWSNGKQTRRL
jgi:Zn finger protein HypA/HybF involved in hydrogenase expression